jgi:hypothetical protein
MDGIVPGLGVGAVRINSDIVSWPVRDGTVRREKIPAAPGERWVGLVLLFSMETGEPLAIFPDGYLQRLRVGAANGLGINTWPGKMPKPLPCLEAAGRPVARQWQLQQ